MTNQKHTLAPTAHTNSQCTSVDQHSRVMQRQCSKPANSSDPTRVYKSLDAESGKALAMFFREGRFRDRGCINSKNVDKYLAISRQLHHKQLQTECELFIRNNKLCRRLSLEPRSHNEAVRYQLMFTRNGSDRTSTPLSVNLYDCRNNFQKTCRVPELSAVGTGFAVCCLQDHNYDAPHVYLSGGGKCLLDVYHCDIVMNKMKKCSKRLVKGRSHHCMTCVQNKLYVLGGQCSKGETIRTVEEFAPKRHSWKTVGNLDIGVHSATTVVHGSHVYVFGGILDNGKETAIVQMFDPQTKTCKILANLPFPVSGAQAVVREGKIFVTCGKGRLVSYDPASDQHDICTNMPVCCTNFAMFNEKEGIFFAGGKTRNDDDAVKNIYVYSPEDCTWHVTDKDLSTSLNVYGSCSVEIPAEYGLVPFFN
ncbi:kelch-like protein 35 [Mizuhopecten yessoensis]|uniref:kelch-like protein 35 n=1 Tax=Mizuhopecten yessoensis TaxID=6573 RepID=UPI000B45CBED|nr:kelch-like protein 35 [Mizuhopecten yessoensis]XP_021365273.1 kelch-like protein 35 [Mizuhopecten yessoensis]